MPSGPQQLVSQFGDLAILLLVGFPRRCFRRFALWLPCSLLGWLTVHFGILTDLDGLTPRDRLMTCCQRPAALYRASGNRYFPFAHGPLNLSTPGPKSVDPVWPTCPLRTASNRGSAHCCRPAGSRDACRTPVCRSAAEMWHFFSRSKVHGRVQSPVEFCYPPFTNGTLQTALVHSPLLGLQTLLYSILGLQTLLFSILGLQTLFFSNRSSPRRYYANSPRIW